MNDAFFWRAVQTRDRRNAAAFVYGVRTTGIYCRAWCPSRRPHRRAVVFFPTPSDAERAGFRACLRCHPRTPETNARRDAVVRACRYLASRETAPKLREVAAHVGLSAHHFQRVFTDAIGLSPREYAAWCRATRFKAALKRGDAIASATYEVGYGSSSRVYEQATTRLGMTPAAYQNGGRGMDVAFVITRCRLGRLLVAATPRGVCSVKMGDDDEALVEDLRKEFPAARLVRPTPPMAEWVTALVGHLDGRIRDADLPLDVQATAFQWRVWRELQAIPYGSTRTYSDVARLIGKPTAARAVARACATNPVALIIPCHRVVREGGGMGGYRWGIDRKESLIADELKAAK